MILLTSTGALLKVVTGGTQILNVHASYVDVNASNVVTPTSLNTVINLATTTTIVASPGASVQRNIKFLSIRNTDASTAVSITVQHYDGTSTAVLQALSLLAGYTLTYNDLLGWDLLSSTGIGGSYISDGLHGPAGVKPASTAAVAADPALVVALSPNSNTPVVADVTATGALGALNAAVQVATAGLNTAGFQLAAGTFIGTLVAEVSFDAGTTWDATYFDTPASGKVSTIVFSSSNTATAATIVGVGGSGLSRVRVSLYTSGTANITVRATTRTDPSVLFAGPAGSAVPPSTAYVGGWDGTNLVPIRLKNASTAAVAADPALVTAPSPNTSGPVQIITAAELAAGLSPATVFPAGFLHTTDEPRQLLYDPFDGTILDTNNWVPAVFSGGGVGAVISAGSLVLGTGTTTSGYSYLASQNSFRLTVPGWLGVSHAITTEFPVTANTYRFWGEGTIPTAPTSSSQSLAGNSLTNGVGWELGTDGKLLAVVWANGVRTIVQDLSAATGNSKQPTDGLPHRYAINVRTDKIYWVIDGADVPVATSLFVSPSIQTLPLLFLCIAGTSPISSGVLTVLGIAAWDTAKNSVAIGDGVYGWRKASVIPANTAVTSAASALNVTLSPNGLTPGGLVDQLGPQVSAVLTDQYGNNQPPTASFLEGILTAINDLRDAVVFGGLGAGNGHAQVMISDSHSAPVAIKQAKSHALISDPSLVAQLSPLQQPVPTQAAPQGAVAYNYSGYTGANTFFQFVGGSENEIFSNAASPSILSASALDVLGGTGAWSVVIVYYDQYLNGPFSVQVNLNGTTPVNFANLLPNPLCYIEQFYVNAWGNTYQNQGNLVIWSGAGGSGTNVVQMNSGDCQTFYCRHYIPKGVTSFITGMTLSLGAAGIVTGFISATPNINSAGSVNIGGQTNMTGFIGGNQGVQYNFPTPIPCVGPSRFYMQATTTITTGVLYGTMSFYDLPTAVTQLPINPLIPGVQTLPSQVPYK